MKLPLVDGLVRWSTLAASAAGLLPTAATWSPGDLDRADGILVVISTALGDSVSFTPALEALRLGAPKARLVGLYHAAFAAMYAGDPRLDAVIPYYGKYRRVGETVRALRRARCEVALLDPALWSGEDPPRVGMDRLTPDEVFRVLREFWGAAS